MELINHNLCIHLCQWQSQILNFYLNYHFAGNLRLALHKFQPHLAFCVSDAPLFLFTCLRSDLSASIMHYVMHSARAKPQVVIVLALILLGSLVPRLLPCSQVMEQHTLWVKFGVHFVHNTSSTSLVTSLKYLQKICLVR